MHGNPYRDRHLAAPRENGERYATTPMVGHLCESSQLSDALGGVPARLGEHAEPSDVHHTILFLCRDVLGVNPEGLSLTPRARPARRPEHP